MLAIWQGISVRPYMPGKTYSAFTHFFLQEKTTMKLNTILLTIVLALSATPALADGELEIVTGKNWMGSSLEQKRAYLFGIGNVLQIERAMAGDDYQSMRGSSIVPVLLDGLSEVPLNDIVMQLDEFYTENADQNGRAVIEVLYLELALPNL
jgi:hypothetical protein